MDLWINYLVLTKITLTR